MNSMLDILRRNRKQIIFQTVLILFLCFFYVFERRRDGFEFLGYKLTYFLNYLIAAFIISYWILPKYYYTKKYTLLVTSIVLVLSLTLCIEEFLLERIYFADSRYLYFDYFHALFDILPICFILVSFKFIWDVHEKSKEVEQLKNAVQKSELQFLKSQINPHFLFNNLNNLYSYALVNSAKTPEIILELSTVLRYMLYDCKEQYVPLKKEIDHLRNFINLNELQIEERGNIQFSSSHIPHQLKIAPLLLSVFVENAFKHSTASQSDNINIQVSIDVDESGKLLFYCKNSYLPDMNNQSLSKGIGLINVKKRLDILYKDRYELDINQESNEYIVRLAIKLS